MLRFVPPMLALGLAVLWVIGLSEDATVWLTWTVGTLAIPALAVTGLVPERRGSAWAAGCLALVAAALLIAWLVGWRTNGDPWLAWWTLVFALLTFGAAAGLALQGTIDQLRARPII
jgi:peptidoglycan/LPS O-acetylase OafA/YrhL